MMVDDAGLQARLRTKLAPYDQQHLLQFWDRLSSQQHAELAAQIDALDLEQLRQLFAGDVSEPDWAGIAARAESPPAIRIGQKQNSIPAAEARAAGEAAFRQGRVAMLVVAGGQGSRLGFDHPKGMFPLGPVSGRSLFQIHADRIAAATLRYGATIPWYVMTSPATHEETAAYFQQTHGCGLSDARLFCQGTMPAVDAASGRLLLAEPHQLFTSPDGHGGTLDALARSGCLEQMASRGIAHVVYFQVDNPLVDVADPEFLGYHILARSEMTTQVVAKKDAQEKVGNLVAVDGTLRIIEYSDLPEAQAARRTASGELAIWAGSIAVHGFEVSFLRRMQDRTDALPFHRALKKVPYIDDSGCRVEPDEPNAVKFERFIFDLLPYAENALVVEVDPAEAFAPVKNGPEAATDTATTARQAMVAQHRRWLRAAGVLVDDQVQVELNPLFAGDVETLREKVKPGACVSQDIYFGPPVSP